MHARRSIQTSLSPREIETERGREEEKERKIPFRDHSFVRANDCRCDGKSPADPEENAISFGKWSATSSHGSPLSGERNSCNPFAEHDEITNNYWHLAARMRCTANYWLPAEITRN